MNTVIGKNSSESTDEKEKRMYNICRYCYYDKTSHSLEKIKTQTILNSACSRVSSSNSACGRITYYTCPSKAKMYNDTESIIEHYRNEFSETLKEPSTKWVWIFDADGFSMKHAMYLSLAKKLTKVIMFEFGEQLEEVRIINPTTFIKITINAVWYLMSKEMRKKIKIIGGNRKDYIPIANE